MAATMIMTLGTPTMQAVAGGTSSSHGRGGSSSSRWPLVGVVLVLATTTWQEGAST